MPQSGNKLPNPELNPLLNPTLGQNLGKWAQVYFTNPPEKRDEAVLELLRELEENGPADAAGTDSFPAPDSFEAMRLEHLKAEAAAAPITAELHEPVMVCPACQQGNPASQKFCGFCGAVLAPVSEPVRNEVPVEMAPEPRPLEPPSPESDIDWLRNSAVAGFDPDTQKQGGWWKYGLTGVLILLAGFGYLEYVSRIPPKVVVANPNSTTQPQAEGPQENPPAPVAANAPGPDRPIETDIPPVKNAGAPSAETTSPARPAAPTAAPEKEAASQPDSHPAPPETNAAYTEKEITPAKTSPSKALATATDSAAPSSLDNGAVELKQAQDFLEGRNVPHDSGAAARLLWRAVSKQNIAASVMLADMYEAGDGVPKSCDQARLLLVAASKKGSAQAADKLRSLESGGCR